MVRSASRRGRSPGTVTVKCLGETELRPAKGLNACRASHYEYRYVAPSDIPQSLGRYDGLAFDVFTARDGVRRFVPSAAYGLQGFLDRAFQIGHSLKQRTLDKPESDEILLGKLAYDWLIHARERLQPRKLDDEDLLVTHRRNELHRADSLPDDLFCEDEACRGSSRVQRVIERGDAAARRRDIAQPTPTEVIACGLTELAAERPLQVGEPERIRALIRLALFDLPDAPEEIRKKTLNELGDRFEEAVRSRLYEPQNTFNRWLYGGEASMLRTVERRLVGIDKSHLRAVSRSHMLEHAWHGFLHVSECLEEFARSFALALPKPLSPAERPLFAAMYRAQPYLGGLVLPLLLDVQDLLQPIIVELWNNPGDRTTIETFHRLLQYRGEILARVREADRVAKQPRPAVPDFADKHHNDKHLERQRERQPNQVSAESMVCQELFEHIFELRNIECMHASCTARLHADSDLRQAADSATINVTAMCPEHGQVKTICVTLEELQKHHSKLFD